MITTLLVIHDFHLHLLQEEVGSRSAIHKGCSLVKKIICEYFHAEDGCCFYDQICLGLSLLLFGRSLADGILRSTFPKLPFSDLNKGCCVHGRTLCWLRYYSSGTITGGHQGLEDQSHCFCNSFQSLMIL